jgi:DHA1 family multidrug resistance protein-like MFS transporter
MLDALHRTYLAIFRRYPVLSRMALMVVLGEIVQSSVNNFALPFYVLDDLQEPGRVLGALISTFLIAEMLLKLPFGHLSDRHGRRRFVVMGISCSAATSLAICLVPTQAFLAFPVLAYVVLVPLRALDGAGAASLWPPLFASVPDHIPSRERGVAMSVMNTAYLAGLASGPAAAGAAMGLWKVLARAGLEPALPHWEGKAPFAMAVLAAATGAVVAGGLPRGPAGAGRESARPAANAAWPPPGVVAVIMLITLSEMFATGTLAPYLAPYLQRAAGIPRESVGFLLVALFIPAGLLGLPLGHLADRWPKRRVVQAALGIAAAGLWGVPCCRALPPLIFFGIVVMLGFMLGLPAWLALISDLAPPGRAGRVMGLMATAQGLGAFLGPLAGGYLWDANIRYPFFAAATLLTLSALIALLFIRLAAPPE